MSVTRRVQFSLLLAACLALPAAGRQDTPPAQTPAQPAPAQPAPAQPATAQTAPSQAPATPDTTQPAATPATPMPAEAPPQPAAPAGTAEPQAANTGNVPAGAPAVNPAAPPGTAPGQPSQGSIGPSPAGTVPSSAPGATPGGGQRHNPATGAPAAPGGAPKGPPGAGANRMDFNLKFEDGGTAAGSAVTFDYKRNDYAVLTGAVQVHYQDLELSADHVEIDLTSKQVVAQGNVILDQGPKRLTGTTLNFDLDTKTGKMLEATAYVAPDYYFSGVEVDKTGEDTYEVFDGLFTSCVQKTPDWSFHLARARVEVEGYAHMRNVTFRVKELPLFYTPWLLYPAKKDRASGMLMPSIHSSGQRGSSISLAYFQTLGQSFDDTVYLEPYIRGYLGAGDEFRYHPTEGTWGDVEGYAVKDPADKGKLRWKVRADHDTEDLPFGMRMVMQYQKYSDFDYLRDFEHDFDTSSLRFIDSRAFLTGNWGPNLLNILVNDRQILFNNGTDFVSDVDQKKLPEVEYQVRSTKIGSTPFYLEMDNFLDYLDIIRPDSYSGEYGRIDLFPQITLPVNTFSWLNFSLTGGYRYTFYQKSLATTFTTVPGVPVPGAPPPPPVTTETQAFANTSLHRALPYGSAELVGPSFSKIMEKEIAGFAKFKHVIEPRVTYTYYGPFSDFRQLALPQFDQIDGPLSTNNVRVALDNRLLAKSGEENASAREVMLFEVSRMYSFDSKMPFEESLDLIRRSNASPWDFLLRFNPSEKTSVKGEVQYSGLFGRIASTSLSSDLSLPGNQIVGLTWFVNYLPETGMTESNEVRVNTALNVIPQKLSLQAQVGWDVQNHVLGQQYYAINWSEQCYGLRLEIRQFKALVGPRLSDTSIRFSLSLKNIGTVLDLNNRSTQTAP
ncbi:MAG TPA: LPS assembly protein LptD [Thermoanaerobaculia bacterium]|nr:LPS assembly protein LptD [Thermoanaerobaculia bacterium]